MTGGTGGAFRSDHRGRAGDPYMEWSVAAYYPVASTGQWHEAPDSEASLSGTA